MSLQLSVSFPTPGTPMFVPSSSWILLDPSSYMSSVAQIPSHGETEKKNLPSASTPLSFQWQTQVHFHQSSLMEPRSSLGLLTKQWVRRYLQDCGCSTSKRPHWTVFIWQKKWGSHSCLDGAPSPSSAPLISPNSSPKPHSVYRIRAELHTAS